MGCLELRRSRRLGEVNPTRSAPSPPAGDARGVTSVTRLHSGVAVSWCDPCGECGLQVRQDPSHKSDMNTLPHQNLHQKLPRSPLGEYYSSFLIILFPFSSFPPLRVF
jgi:hypothetical protein